LKVLDHEPWFWFLLEDEGRLFVDANCNHSAFGYIFMIELSAQEVATYQAEGRSFIRRLAQDIQNTAPILQVSTSPYKGRDVSNLYSDQVTLAVQAWRAKNCDMQKYMS